jgi:hypothetical protein
MPVEVSGNIIYNPDAKDDKYKIICKSLDIEEEGSGTIEDDIETLRQRITDAIVEEFKVSPEEVKLTGYRMTMNFEISGPVNYTLDKFNKKKEEDQD